MKRLSIIGLACVVFVGASRLAAAQAPAPAQARPSSPAPASLLTLDAAVALASEQNRQLQSSALEVAKAEDGLALARLRRLPVFNVNLIASQSVTQTTFSVPKGAFGTFASTGPIPPDDTKITRSRDPIAFAYVTAAQPLTQLSRINLGVKASETSRDIEQARAQRAALEIAANVRKLYYALLQTDSALRAADAAIDAARELDREMQERASRRAILPADAGDASLKLAQAEQTRLSLSHSLDSQKEQLNLLIGRDVRTPFALEMVREPSLDRDDVDAAITQARAARPDVREARLRVEQADLDRRAKLAERLPDLSLVVTYVSLFNVDFLPRNLAGVGVQLQWEPWDWGRKRREATQKAKTVDEAKLAVREAEDQVALEVLAAVRRLEDAAAQLRVARLAQEVATERLRERTEQLKLNAALAAEALQAQAQLSDATARHQQAIAAYWSARAEFERARGDAPSANALPAAPPSR